MADRLDQQSLTLLEYLVKHGAERVVDDARSHLSTIKILRNFHYIDEKGKDQGINVRNRSKELSELLSDVDRIRQERRKARQNKNKYQGVGNGDFVPGSGAGRYGGFSSDQYYSGGVDRYPASAGGSGGGGGGSSSNARQDSFDEYDAGEDAPPRSASSRIGGSSSSAPKSKPQPVVQDLFSFDDDEPAPVPALAAVAASSSTGFDDFDDFQAAPPSAGAPPKPVTKAAPAPPAVAGNAMFDLLGSAPAVAPASRQMGGSTQQPLAPVRSNTASSFASQGSASPTVASAAKPASTAAAGINFDDLWATSAGKPGAGATSGQAGKSGKVSMAELARNQSANNVWGNTAQKAPPMGAQTPLGGGASGAAGKSKDIFDLL